MKRTIYIIIAFLALSCNLFSNENIPGYYEVNVSPHFLSIELKEDSTFEIIDIGDLYPKRTTVGKWTLINDSIISIRSFKQNFPIEEYGEIKGDSLAVKVVDTNNNPLDFAQVSVRYDDGKITGGFTDSTGICNIYYRQKPIISINVYYRNGMFGNSFTIDRTFQGNILITYQSTDNGSIIEKQFYYYRSDTLYSLGKVYEYYDLIGHLAFHKTNDMLKFLDMLFGQADYYQNHAKRNFFNEDLDSAGSKVFSELSKIISYHGKRIKDLYNANKDSILELENLRSYFNDYYDNLNEFYESFYRKSPKRIFVEDFQETIKNFDKILNSLYLKLKYDFE